MSCPKHSELFIR